MDYYDTLDHAQAGEEKGKDPLGKFVRVHYLSNCNKEGGTADNWKFRPMWWFGVPKGLQNVQNIVYTRVEKLTQNEQKQPFTPAGKSQFTFTNTEGYGEVSHKTYPTPKDWKGISNFYLTGDKVLASKGWKQLLGIDNKGSKGYDNAGNTAGQWGDYQGETAGLQGIFVDWESAGQRFYDMTYVGEMTEQAWKERDTNPLRFAAGVYRFAGNWHYAVGQKHNTPRIADHLKLVYPEVTPVKDLKNVSTDEQNTIKKKIATANKDTKHYSELVDKVEVSDKGVATITFKDKTTRTIPAALLVVKNEEDKDKYKPTMPERTPVVNLNKLTSNEKTTIRQAIINANGGSSPNEFLKHIKKDRTGGYDFKVANNGVVSVEYQDGSKITIPASELVYQGATIADWAPYVVPDTITVDNLKQLKTDEINQIIKAFDDANTGITPYDESKAKKNNQAPVTVSDTGDVTITWKDGSTTVIDAWQFLKEKSKTPTPQPPAKEAEKTFIVEAPQTQTQVNFDPFKMKSDDLTNTNNQKTLNGVKSMFTGEKGKDAKDPTKKVNIKSVEYSVDKDGVGYITFKADGYKDAKYPMSVFFKQKPVVSNPTSSTVGPDSAGHTFIVKKYPIAGDTPTDAEKKAALKQFIESNWDNASVDGNSDSYTGGKNWKPKTGTSGIGTAAKDGSGITTISLGADGDIVVKDNRGKTYTIGHDSLYDKNATPKDNTIDKLKEQAKALLKQRQDDGLTNDDLKRAGITNADTLNDNAINGMDEKALRELIRKLTDAKKAAYKYNTNPLEIENDPTSSDFGPSDNQFKDAVKKFLHANYDDLKSSEKIDNLTFDSNSATLTNKGWTPKEGTSDLELKSDYTTYGITTATMGSDGKSVDFKNGDTVLFTVPANKLYKKKAAPEPAPKPGEKSKLDKMKEKAKEAIERNPNLTPEQKKQYEKQVDDANDENGIHTALKAAADKGKENANSTDQNTQQTINNNKSGGDAKKEKEKEQKEKDKKERDKKQEQQLQTDKTNASNDIDKLDNLTKDEKDNLKNEINGDNTPANPNGATTSDAVQKILEKAKAINDAKGALQNDIKKGALPFLDHGTGDKNNTADTHADDAALNELLGTKPGKDQTLTDLDNALKADGATADSINTALDAAKRQNAINEENAKNAGLAKLDAKKAELDAAYNALTGDQKTKAKDKYDAAISAIDTAKKTVEKATKPSDIKNALEGVKTSFDAANKAIEDAKGQRDTSGNDNDKADALTKEKEAQKKRINDSNLSDADKQKAIKDIEAATKLGDPTGIADRALKAKKIADALAAIDKLEHLNDAQKQAYKDIINGTDAGNHKDDDGNDTGVDDIDDALANAIKTDTAMGRLDELKKKANDFKNEQGGKYSKLDNSEGDTKKKKAFDDAFTVAGSVLDKKDGAPKGADEVNTLYNDLLKAMQAIDKTAKGAGVNTEALNKEIESDKKLKPSENDPKTPGDSVYNTSSKEKKDAFDKALDEAEKALKKAKEDNENDKKQGATPRTPEKEAEDQQAVDDALQKLENARKALDGVDTKPLEQQIAKDADIKSSVKYTNASDDKKKAYNKALAAAKKLITDLTTPSADGASAPKYGETTLDTKENKQKALNEALKKLQDAAEALNGRTPEPTPTPTPADVDKTDLAAEIALDNTIGRRISYIISPSDKQDAYNAALAEARRVYGDPNATQEQVNDAVAGLRAAARALSGYGSVDNDVNPLPTPSPIPSPVPGGAGFGVNDNAPTTVDKGELNIQIDSAEADSKPGNAGDGAGNGNANAGNANAGNAGNSGNAGSAPNAQGGAGASAGAGAGAGTTGAAPTGVDNKTVNNAVENAPEVKHADAAVKQAAAALNDALAQAKRVAADPHATQAQVDAAARRLADARKALADAKANAANVRAAVRNRVIKNMRSRGGAGIATGADVATAGLMATMLAAIGGAFATRRIRTKHANRD